VTVEHEDLDDFDAIVDDDDDDDDKQPTKEDFERMQRALTKANAEAKKKRLQYKALLEKTTGGKPDAGDGKDDKNKDREIDRERVRNEVSEAEESKWKKRVVRQAAKAALLEAGLQGDPTKLARLVDEDDVEVDDDGEIADGLEEQIDSIKEDYPDLFEDKSAAPPKNTRRSRNIDGGNRERPPARKLSSAEKIQQQALRTQKRR
jgi:hypothetical protein